MGILYRNLSYRVRGGIYVVFRILCPGFLESIYQRAVEIELARRGIAFEAQKEIKVSYDGIEVGVHKLDSAVEDKIILELKAVDELHPQHEAQIISYLKASGLQLGFLVNFGGEKAKIKRYVNTLRDFPCFPPSSLPAGRQARFPW